MDSLFSRHSQNRQLLKWLSSPPPSHYLSLLSSKDKSRTTDCGVSSSTPTPCASMLISVAHPSFPAASESAEEIQNATRTLCRLLKTAKWRYVIAVATTHLHTRSCFCHFSQKRHGLLPLPTSSKRVDSGVETHSICVQTLASFFDLACSQLRQQIKRSLPLCHLGTASRT